MKDSKRYGCPYCAGQRVGKDNNLAVKYPDLAREWHPTRNAKLRPTDVTPGSNRKVWWRCSHGHEWEATVGSRVRGSGCRTCYNERRGSRLRRRTLRRSGNRKGKIIQTTLATLASD